MRRSNPVDYYLYFNLVPSIIINMNQRTFLYQLQLLDNQIEKNNKRLNEIEEIIADEKEIIEARSKLEQVEKSYNQLNKKFNKISDEASLLSEKIKKSQTSLYDGSVTNHKELQDINTEIASLSKRHTILDEELLELLMAMETAENKAKEAKEQFDLKVKEKNDKTNLLLSEKTTLLKENQKVQIEKEPVINQIDDAYLQIYNKLQRTKNKIAIAPILDGACSICGNILTPMEIQKAKSSQDDIYCPVCKRFLY